MAVTTILNAPRAQPLRLRAGDPRPIPTVVRFQREGAPIARPQPENAHMVTIGVITIEQRKDGNLVLYTRGNEGIRLVIPDSSVNDLMVALDSVLGNRSSRLTPSSG